MYLWKARLLGEFEQVALVKVHHSIPLTTMCASIDSENLQCEAHHGRDLIAEKAMRWLRIGKAIDRLKDGEPPPSLENSIELLKSLLFLTYINENGARGHNINGIVLKRAEVGCRGLYKLTTLGNMHLLRQRTTMIEQILRDVAENNLPPLSHAIHCSKSDQAVAAAHIKNSFAFADTCMLKHPVADLCQAR